MKPEKMVDERLAQLGLPDDLSEVGLTGSPTPDGATLDRIRKSTLTKVTASGTPGSTAKFGTRRALSVAGVAAILLAALLAFVGPANVLAGMNRLLTFVPGLGFHEPAAISLALALPVRVEEGEHWVEVNGMAVTGSYIDVRIASRGVQLWGDGAVYLEVAGSRLHPEQLSQTAMTGARSGAGTGTDHAHYDAVYRFIAPGVTPEASVSLVVAERRTWRIPVALASAEALVTLDGFGPSMTKHGVTVAARAVARSGETEVTLYLTSTESEVQFWPLFGMGGTTLEPSLSSGEWRSGLRSQIMEAGGLQQLRGNAYPAETSRLTLHIPALDLQLPGEGHVELPVLTGPIGHSVRLGDWTIELDRAEVQNGEMKIYVRTGSDEHAELVGFNTLRVDGDWAAGRFFSGPVRLHAFAFQVPDGASSVRLTLQDPLVRIYGDWTLELPVPPQP